MNIFIYSDESGVFDKAHNNTFVFGGLIILGKDAKEEWSRRYAAAEKSIRMSKCVNNDYELKATHISNKEKGKPFRSLNNCYKFGVVIDQNKVLEEIFKSKKDKQRFLDYVYKIAVKRALEELIAKGVIVPNQIKSLYFYVDEHTTATNGRYELKEGLEKEFKNGTYNCNWNIFYPPLFTELESVNVDFCNSQSKLLVRAADIVANKIYFLANTQRIFELKEISNLRITYFP